MTKLNGWYAEDPRGDGVVSPMDLFDGCAAVTLTDEHAASSYGIPVVVDSSGSVVNPHSLPRTKICGHDCEPERSGDAEFVARARAAGYDVFLADAIEPSPSKG